MVIRLVAQGHALLPEHPAALLVDVQAGLDGICGGLLLEDAAHAVEQLEDTSGGIRVGYRPMCLCTLMVRGRLLRGIYLMRHTGLCRPNAGKSAKLRIRFVAAEATMNHWSCSKWPSTAR